MRPFLGDAARTRFVFSEFCVSPVCMKLGVFGTSVMDLKLQVEIKQSREELEKAVKYAAEASSKERLQMLYWLKTGQATSRRSRF